MIGPMSSGKPTSKHIAEAKAGQEALSKFEGVVLTDLICAIEGETIS
jgi:hypothetical protein